MSYESFVAGKLAPDQPTGFSPRGRLAGNLFPFQNDLVRWALRRGRAAIFANTGLGKTRMQLSWAHHVSKRIGERVLILAPLAVSAQTVAEAADVGIKATVVRGPREVVPGINVTNYERFEKLNPRSFGAVVLDESSRIKHHDTKTLAKLLDAWRETPWKLCCSATPAPNDWTELGTHAEFLGVCKRTEMLSEYFVHDGGETQKWRLKGHARSEFWRWVASWGALVGHPRDLGYDDDSFNLEPLNLHEHVVKSGAPLPGELFVLEAGGLMDRRRARRASIGARVEACASVVAKDPTEPWVVWCDLNDESTALVNAIPGAQEIRGSMTVNEKERHLEAFSSGELRVLVTKPSIAGFGLNWQRCARMAFVGVTDSWEAYYQAVRRCWRFGQKRPVHVHIFASQQEGSVVANLKRKDADAEKLAEQLARETAETIKASVRGATRSTNPYDPKNKLEVPKWLRTDQP